MWNGLSDTIRCVRGNCDTEVDQMVLTFSILADYAVLPAGERLVYVTHGHIFNTQTPPPLRKGDVLLHGHRHFSACVPFGSDILYLKPGSVSISKIVTAHGYMTLENGVFTWKTLSGEPYHEWKMEN